jgi:hypothetical protein
VAVLVVFGDASAAFQAYFAVASDPLQVGDGAAVGSLDVGCADCAYNLQASVRFKNKR